MIALKGLHLRRFETLKRTNSLVLPPQRDGSHERSQFARIVIIRRQIGMENLVKVTAGALNICEFFQDRQPDFF